MGRAVGCQALILSPRPAVQLRGPWRLFSLELDSRLPPCRRPQYTFGTHWPSGHPPANPLTRLFPHPTVHREHLLCAQPWGCKAPGLVRNRQVGNSAQGVGSGDSERRRGPGPSIDGTGSHSSYCTSEFFPASAPGAGARMAGTGMTGAGWLVPGWLAARMAGAGLLVTGWLVPDQMAGT